MKTKQTFTLKNQNVMKTKKYLVPMKVLAAVVFAFVFSAFLNAQFVPPSPSSNTQTAQEVRATSTVTYDLSLNHTVGEEYRWAVRGGTITGGTPSGDSSILGWTANLDLITVTWDTDITATPIGSAPGEIIVQKRTGTNCPSELQVLDITMWNPATANLDLTGLVTEMCSGDGLGGNVAVDLTGAPRIPADGFEVTYSISAPDITDLIDNSVDVTDAILPDNDELAQIPLPAGLKNISATGADATFTLTITAMHDDFGGNGTLGLTTTYAITVHPTPTTGVINSSTSLSRR
jgi:hypothetical protein